LQAPKLDFDRLRKNQGGRLRDGPTIGARSTKIVRIRWGFGVMPGELGRCDCVVAGAEMPLKLCEMGTY